MIGDISFADSIYIVTGYTDYPRRFSRTLINTEFLNYLLE